ncbi:MGMT family protein [Humisphaera borealis]|uniref:methylated-DNA--[protein]-cysteine S-methyltransferase n=1 Tax=Humisphaera borealis TaxID=2807512 RepID=A0A7M2WQB6_9BACT|nr:MGMT family protein [Humisphaera borealis]QOV87593.1 MGMT family protein [Humisphaera borealis]
MQFLDDILAGRVVPGMNFNQKVWAMTVRIPAGKVATYGQVAKALGSPGAARAVGNALNKNPYAPRVPCHRVVGSTGSLTGFAGGLPKKQQLLIEEGVACAAHRVVMDRVEWVEL